MNLDDFHAYVSVLNDRFCTNWKFMKEHYPNLSFEMDRDEWIELLIQFIENDRQ